MRYLLVVAVVVLSALGAPPANSQPDPDESTFDARMAVSPCNNEPDLPSNARLKYAGIIRDAEGDPIEGNDELGMNFYPGPGTGCGAPMPTAWQPDEPSDENGYVVWTEELYSEHGTPGCGPLILDWGYGVDLHFVEKYDAQSAPKAGLRNLDHDLDLNVALNDLYWWQQAFVGTGPVHWGDFSRDDKVALADLSIWQQHYYACNNDGVNPESSGEISGVIDRPYLYVHVVDRLAQGVPIPIVYPEQAVNSVGEVGPRGREVTVLLFAVDYGAIAAVEVHCEWPDSWAVEDVDDTLLEGQVLGCPEPGIHRKLYATAFNCIVGGNPTAVGRFDMHARGAGAVTLRASQPPRVVDCELREWEVGLDRLGYPHPDRPPTGGGMSLVRSSSIATTGGAQFRLLGNAGAPVKAVVHDVAGRAIKELQVSSSGTEQIVTWDGTNEGGARAASGVYYVLIRVGQSRFVERTLLVR